MEYQQVVKNNTYIITEVNHDYMNPVKAETFAFDTENVVLLNGVQMDQDSMLNALDGLTMNEKRDLLRSNVWAWQCYDEFNGFFMTNNFYCWLDYLARVGYKFGWCYNAKFDFSQIDYKILVENKKGWQQHEEGKKDAAWQYNSIHNDMGARYSYKLWIPYKHNNRHKYVHSVDLRDFMNIFAGGLARTLESLNVVDNEGNKIRKLEMDYQAVDYMNLTQQEIDYCCNDVKGLYFAIKQYNEVIVDQSNGECAIFGKGTNLMTAGGFAKKEMLRSIYPKLQPKERLKKFQKDHPIDEEEDIFARQHFLYRGGICYVNPNFQGRLATASEMGAKMNRYDVNSEYPYSMSIIHDLKGKGKMISYKSWQNMTHKERKKYECIIYLKSVYGDVKEGFWGLWYDPFKMEYVEHVDENGLHLIYESELNELLKWYDLEYECDEVMIFKRGGLIFKKFVEENYEIKRQAKKDKNKGIEAVSKLKLNSSYGKLAERVSRVIGHYEENLETGAVHFVSDREETDMTAVMNVYLGALVSSTARTYIMSKIREIHGNKMKELALYIDTDSIHTFATYKDADAYSLGGLKLEAECDAVKYLLPKTYIDCEFEEGKILAQKCEVHTKGINLRVVKKELSSVENLTLDYIDSNFDYGKIYVCLCAINVKGGKVLIPVKKYLARPELDPSLIETHGYDGGYYFEK